MDKPDKPGTKGTKDTTGMTKARGRRETRGPRLDPSQPGDLSSMLPSREDRMLRPFLAVEVTSGVDDLGYALVDPYDIQMAFKLPALEKGHVDAPWISARRLRRKPVYVLTKDGLYRTRYESIASFLKGLPAYFFKANASLVVNLRKARSFELMQTKQKSVVFPGRDGRRFGDRVLLSRRSASRLRGWLYIRTPDDDTGDERPGGSNEPGSSNERPELPE